MSKEYKFTKQDLLREINELREETYRESSNQRERERNAIRLLTVGAYCLAIGYLLGKPRQTSDESEH